MRYFDNPTQVKFYDSDAGECGEYVGGIAYRNEVICGCCGGTFEIEELCEYAPSGVNPIIICEDWMDIAHEICRD